MKRVLLYLFLAVSLLASCKREPDAVFEMSPDERLNKAISDYQTALTGSQYGWNGTLVTAAGSVYHFHFGFNTTERVLMYGDVDTTSASVRKESSFRLKAQQQPSLIFDTYSYIHQLADPDAAVNGGVYGSGLFSDFEFSLDTLTTDSIRLTGRFQGSKMILKKATQADLQAWQNGQWKTAMLFEYTSKYILNYFKRLVTATRQYEIQVDPVSRTVTFSWLEGTTLRTHTTAYYFTAQGVVLEDPLVDGANNITSIANINWNGTVFNVSLNGTTASTIAGAIAPVKVDVQAPQRWWQTQWQIDDYWYSWTGFHVNGVDDAFGLRKLPNFYYLLLWPAYETNYDLTGFTFLVNGSLSLPFGAGTQLPPTFTVDGRVIFPFLGTLGTVPADMQDEYVATAQRLINASGFYLIQTSANSYDMVSANDAKTWITWEK